MPELPEVETTMRGIAPHVIGREIAKVILRRAELRLPISGGVGELAGTRVTELRRRSKYILAGLSDGTTLLFHLGMSGSLRLAQPGEDWRKHDHAGISFCGGLELRFHDPRRFGILLRFSGPAAAHPLLASLGPEPFGEEFGAGWLRARCRERKTAVKQLVMDAKVVVGVGNIYASEALFRAGIRPGTAAGKLTKPRLEKLVAAIRSVLTESIEAGGTTLRDFLHSTGEPGYFKQRLFVYGRAGEACRVCGEPIRQTLMGGRSTFWCVTCQR